MGPPRVGNGGAVVDDHGVVVVEDPAHPVASGLEGTVTMATSVQKMGYAAGSRLGGWTRSARWSRSTREHV